MAWEIIGGAIATALGGGGIVGALISRRQVVSEAELTAVEAAEKVNGMMIKRIEQLTADVDRLEEEVEQERADCAVRLKRQDDKIERLERLLLSKQDRTDPDGSKSNA